MSKPLGPYSPILRTGPWLIASGQVGAVDGALVDGLEGQVRQALSNLSGLLEGEGASLANVVKTTVFLDNMDDFAEMNGYYSEIFGDTRPARSCVEVARLPLDAVFECEAWAWVGEG